MNAPCPSALTIEDRASECYRTIWISDVHLGIAGARQRDLRAAALAALHIDRTLPRQRALHCSWESWSRQFLDYLQPIVRAVPLQGDG